MKTKMLSNIATSAEFLCRTTTIDDKSILNSNKYIEMANIAVSDHNIKQNTELYFVEIDKAVWFNDLCAGYLYHLSIKVDTREEVKIIDKMVWKGSSRNVIPGPDVVTEKPTTNTLISVSTAKIEKLVTLALHESKYQWQTSSEEMEKLLASGVVVDTELLGDIPKGTGYIKFIMYHLYFTPQEKAQGQETIRISILHRKWLYTLDDTVAASLYRKMQNQETVLKPLQPPCAVPRRKGKKVAPPDIPVPRRKGKKVAPSDIPVLSSTIELLEIDLDSPTILSCAWHAVDEYNFKEGAQLEIMNVLKAERTMCAGIVFQLILDAKDQGVLKFFHTKLWSKTWMKTVDILSPLTEAAPNEAMKLLHDPPARGKRQKTTVDGLLLHDAPARRKRKKVV